MNEHDLAVLTRPLPAYRLEAGDVGTIVHVYSEQKGFEVEFATSGGELSVVVTLESTDVRPFNNNEILHVRPVAA